MLAELMRLQDGIAIAGSHGKTTTTSLVATVLRAAKLDPTVVIGGKLNVLGSERRARHRATCWWPRPTSRDGSFLHLSPVISVVTNIDPEHLDHYRDHEQIKDAFVEFATACRSTAWWWRASITRTCRTSCRASRSAWSRTASPRRPTTRRATSSSKGLSSSFELVRRGQALGRFARAACRACTTCSTRSPTIAVADEVGIDHAITREALATFAGVQRRFTVLGERRGVTVVDDYGHHPAEIEATLEAALRAYGRRVVVAFQPHRYTRTHHLFDELTRAFNRADVLLVTDVYAAGEAPIAGADSASSGRRDPRARPPRRHLRAGRARELAASSAKRVQRGDIVITLGAGSITRTGPELIKALEGAG